MAKKKNDEESEPQVTGKVKKITVKGRGRNSGHIEFVVDGETFMITGPPPETQIPKPKDEGYEPYLFTAMANLIIAAYYDRDEVTVKFIKDPALTHRPTEIQVLRGKKK